MATINRRHFLTGAVATGAAVGLGTLGGAALGPGALGLGDLLGPAAASAADATTPAAGPLVLIDLGGGNDGLNTVVPYESGIYRAWRGSIAIPGEQVLPIGSFDGLALGLHPSMTGLQSLWQAGHVAVICGVEYPNPNFSHFQSATIWQTADLSGDQGTGWLGRWLDVTGTDPLRALSVGPTLPAAFVGAKQQAGTLADSTSGGSQLPGQNPTFMSAYKRVMTPYAGQVVLGRAAASAGTGLLTIGRDAETALDTVNPPADVGGRDAGDIGTQLDVVAQCIAYGLPTRAYGVAFGSFDTHSDQLGTHAGLLGQLDAAIENFMTLFSAAAAGKSPVLLAYSEFGRTPRANASSGTDHSSANVVLAVGPSVKGGFYGAMPSFTRLDEYGNLKYTTDFRSVYATVLESVLGVDAKDILGRAFSPIPYL